MKSLTKVLLIGVMISLLGFTYITTENTRITETVNSSELTNVNDETTVNTKLVEYTDKGMMRASWYGPRFHGKITANGEIYDQMAFTAAHKYLKFGTLLRITNPKNNKSVVVRINDRGPYISGRQLDLSKAAAMELEMVEKGVVKLKVEEITLKGLNLPIVAFY